MPLPLSETNRTQDVIGIVFVSIVGRYLERVAVIQLNAILTRKEHHDDCLGITKSS